MRDWTVTEPTVIDVAEPVRRLDVRLVGGHVDVVTHDADGARVEVGTVDGAPLRVRMSGGELTVAHEELSRDGLIGWLRAPRERRHAIVSVAVPDGCEVAVGLVTADAVVAGVAGPVQVRNVSGEVTLDGTTGDVRVQSVSGDVAARGLAGSVALTSVSGGLTVVGGRATTVRARSVSGDVALDVEPDATVEIDVATVSGDLTVRLPDAVGLHVDVASASGQVASAFEGLSLRSAPGSSKLTGDVGAGTGSLRGRTVSGSVALLAREPA